MRSLRSVGSSGGLRFALRVAPVRLAAGGSFIFVCKPARHKTLSEYLTGVELDGFERTVGVGAAKRRHRVCSKLRRRYRASGISTRYYNPEIHVASFTLPSYVLDAIG